VPLRTRLILLLVVLSAAALAVTEAITYSSLKSSLFSQTDQGLQQSAVSLNRVIIGVLRGEQAPDGCDGIQLNTFAVAYGGAGKWDPVISVVCNQKGGSAPSIPSSVLTAAYNSNGSVYTSIGQHGLSYRVLVEPGNDVGAPFPVLAFGIPLTGVNATLRHHLRVDLVVSLLVLLALVIAAWALVRLGLRPLERMTTTAREIAAGDLTKRVDDTDERTEVGQLGAALNVMLTQIERAFQERAASEDRLRRFVGDASHELRTPLTSIRGYAELFKDGAAGRPEDLAAALHRIESESARMGGLVDDLLLLARLDQGRPLGQDRVDLAQLAADAVQDASVVDPSRSIQLISSGPCVVLGDEQRLRQVLGNLLSNAMAYSPPGSPIEVAAHLDWAAVDVSGLPGLPTLPVPGKFGRLGRPGRATGPPDLPGTPARPLAASDLVLGGEAAAAGNPPSDRVNGDGAAAGSGPPEQKGVASPPAGAPDERTPAAGPPPAEPAAAGRAAWYGARAAVAVIDHGPGITAENLSHVFERFWRADQSRQRGSGGSGLGLSIVAAVVAAHGGQVTINPTPGGGATFVVELPVAPPLADNGPGRGVDVTAEAGT
jgi:two-component system OmpR family sensor kinase